MILSETHYIKPTHQNFTHCDWLSFIVKNLRNSANYHIRQHIFNEDKKKKALTGLASVCGFDMKKYITKSSFLDNDPTGTCVPHRNWIFNSTTLYHALKNHPNFRCDKHLEYIEINKTSTTHIKQKINYYQNLTFKQYLEQRINKIKNKKIINKPNNHLKNDKNSNNNNDGNSKISVNISSKKIKALKKKITLKSFNQWKSKKIARLQSQLLPLNINTKILKQVFRELNQNYSDYFKALKDYKINPHKYKSIPKLPGYKPKGSTGRATATIPIEAISNNITKKDKLKFLEVGININEIEKSYEKQDKEIYFYTLANFNILIQSHIPKEKIKEIKIVPLTLGYKILVIYDTLVSPSDEALAMTVSSTPCPCDDNSHIKDTTNPIDENLYNSNDNALINTNSSKDKNLKTTKKDKKGDNNTLIKNTIKTLLAQGKVIAAADLGLNNTLTLVTTTPTINPLLINGRVIKSINQYYNKTLASKKSELSKTSFNLTSQSIKALTQKRNHQIDTMLHQISSYVVNWLKNNDIKALIVGYNENWKVEINIGSKNNQNFVQIPFLKLINQLKYKCEKEGIILLLTEESYTSQASFLDLDILPTYQKDVKNSIQFSGKRVKRGLYKSSGGITINADVNGAYNILRKVIGNEWVKTYSNLIVDYAINPITITCSSRSSYKTNKLY